MEKSAKDPLLLVGIGGYGRVYVEGILENAEKNGAYWAGAVDPYGKDSPQYPLLEARGIPLYDSLEAFYREHSATVAMIATPIPLHAEQAKACLASGSHVMVEKPIAPTVREARDMIAARDKSGLLMAVGYQWCYDETMLRVKADINAGKFGKPVALRVLVMWPRGKAYYARGTGWAGRKALPDGRPVYDHVASNATAHYLENLLWLAGEGYSGAHVTTLQAEGLRANPIEMYDTVCMRGGLSTGGRFLFVTSHATGEGTQQNPMFEYAFEKGTLRFGGYGQTGSHVTAAFPDGTTLDYGATDTGEAGLRKVWRLLDAVRGGPAVPCPPEVALCHTEAMEKLHALVPEGVPFPREMVRENEEMFWVPGLRETLISCYERFALPAEIQA